MANRITVMATLAITRVGLSRFKVAILSISQITVCVTGAGAGVDSVWEQEKLEARKLLESRSGEQASSEHRPAKAHWRLASPASSARCVGLRCFAELFFYISKPSFFK